MDNIYELLKKEIYEKDIVNIDVSLLDKLNNRERQEIEVLLLRKIISGNSSSIKYIRNIKTINVYSFFTENNINKLNLYNKALVFIELFYKSGNYIYMDKAVSLSLTDIQVFSLLMDIYLRMDENSDIARKLYSDICFVIEESNDERYENIFEEKTKDDKTWSDITFSLTKDLGSQEDVDRIVDNLISYRQSKNTKH